MRILSTFSNMSDQIGIQNHVDSAYVNTEMVLDAIPMIAITALDNFKIRNHSALTSYLSYRQQTDTRRQKKIRHT